MNSKYSRRGYGKKSSSQSDYQNTTSNNQKAYSSYQYPSNQSDFSNKSDNEQESFTTKALPFDFNSQLNFSNNEEVNYRDNYYLNFSKNNSYNKKTNFMSKNSFFHSEKSCTITSANITSLTSVPPPPLPLEMFSSNLPSPPLPPVVTPFSRLDIVSSTTTQKDCQIPGLNLLEVSSTEPEPKNNFCDDSSFPSLYLHNKQNFIPDITLKPETFTNTSQQDTLTDESRLKQNEGDSFLQNECKHCSLKFENLKECLAHELVIHFSETQQQSLNNPNNEKLSNKRKKKLKSLLKPNSEEDNCARNDLEEKLLNITDEKIILTKFIQIFQPLKIDLSQAFETISDDLKHELSKQGDWVIQPFGSSINAMALKNSDMDFYISRVVTSGRQYGNKSSFYQVRQLLQNSSHFSGVLAVPRARIPIIKCKHIHTGYNLDVNLTSIIGVHNSKFIASAIQFDSRIHPLLLIIKVWANRWELTKSGRMTNYCLTLLVFFYLQTCSPPVLPTVKQIQSECEPDIVDGFNFAYQVSMNFQRLNHESVFSLLKGFFKFYLTFDFQVNIISPYLGKALLKTEFTTKIIEFPEYDKQVDMITKNINDSTELEQDSWKNSNNNTVNPNQNEMHHTELKLNTSICIQDPFCLTMNKFNSGPNVFAHFIERIRIASVVFNVDQNIKFSDYLVRLLFDTIILNPINTHSVLQKKIKTKNTCVCQLKPLEIEMGFLKLYLKEVEPNKNYTELDYKKIWADKLKMFLIKIFQRDYKITVTKKPNLDLVIKSSKLMEQSDIHENANVEYYSLKSKLDLWGSRKSASLKGEWKKFLTDTIAITEKLLSARENDKKFHVNLDCDLKILTDLNYNSLHIELKNLDEDNKDSLITMKLFFFELTTKIRNTVIAQFNKLQLNEN